MTASRSHATGRARARPAGARKTATTAARKLTSADALAARLERLGLVDDRDFALHLPLRYEDETTLTALEDARDGDAVQLEVVVRDHAIQYRPRRQLVVRADVDDAGALRADGTGRIATGITLRFLHFYGSQTRHFAAGARLRVRGVLRGGGLGHVFGREMVHPTYRVVAAGTPLPDRLTPVYPSAVGLSQAALRRSIAAALARLALDETVPAVSIAKQGLWPIDAALRLLHNPPPDASIEALATRTHAAWQRVKFDELLAQQLSVAKAHRARRARSAPVLKGGGPLVRRFLSDLPFVLTRAQERVIDEIASDLARPHPMQRLLQGDVGSGKTVVSAIAALQAIDAGYQAVLMAPTEILAEQHFRKLSQWIESLDVPVAWLAGSLGKKAKAAARDAIEAGHARLVVGTHALIQEDVHFARLGLAVVDEQHRFGVGQRLALRVKARAGQGPTTAGRASFEPHQLMMSATPIPRTLAMTYYADLDVSTIDELPPGRLPIATRLVDAARRDEVIDRIRVAIAAGRQAYWICPLIEEAADDEEKSSGSAGSADLAKMADPVTASSTTRDRLAMQAAVETYEALTAALPEATVGLVHGRLPARDKADTMRRFASGGIDLLVATTVVEVGVDVPNASLMVIEHAERFGLAQLHQLRGRVGRGADDSVCILLFQPPLSMNAKERLKVLHETQDGFEIARRDLALRGPGEFMGHRQSGEALLRFADLATDQALVDAARETAAAMIADHPDLVDRHLDRWLRGGEDLLKA